ncbi:MAG: NAD-dependent epimerase/dehydratase family protein [Myxococcota bacterium]
MRVIITGGAGFIGSHLCERFVADGHEVVGVDDLSTGARANLAGLEREPRFDLVEADVVDGLGDAPAADAILHFASPASPVDYARLAVETLRAGSEGTLHCLEAARDQGAVFLLASTSEVYGDPQVHPQPEDYWGHVNPVGPRACYDEAKRFAEAATSTYRRVHGVDGRIIRIFNTYGPRMRLGDGRVVPTFMERVLRGRALPVFGDGSQSRSFCFVDDLVEGVVRMVHGDQAGPLNLGNPDEHSILELARICIDLFGGCTSEVIHRDLPADDPKVRRPDIALARRVLGWEPAVGLREGLTRSAPWFRAAVAAGE